MLTNTDIARLRHAQAIMIQYRKEIAAALKANGATSDTAAIVMIGVLAQLINNEQHETD